MTRDYERRQLRDIYDRNRRRVDSIGKARDRSERRRGNNDNNNNNNKSNSSAPRRYIVSERVTRRAGFGDGRRQGRSSGTRLRHDGSRREDRFEDKRVTRRTHRDRFERAERRHDNNNNNGNNSRRRNRNDDSIDSRRGSRRSNDNKLTSKRDSRRNTRNNNGNNNNNNGSSGRRFSRATERRTNNRTANNNNKNNNNSKKHITNKPLSGDDLNAQLEAYANNLVFTPSAKASTTAGSSAFAKASATTFESLDAQLAAYKN